MENALLIGLSRQTALARNLDVIANNMANMRTAGYKGEELMFQEFLMPVAREQDMPGRDKILSYVIDKGLARDFAEGPFQPTNNPMDVAISGKGWFVVETPQGERYTRDGAMKINDRGEMVTTEGFRVLGDGGPIVFGPDETDVNIAPDGTVSSSEGEKGRLRIVAFQNEAAMLREGDNVFSSPEAPTIPEFVRLNSGMLEGSNVRAVVETARMIDVTRAYASTVQMIERMQEMRRDAVERLGAVPQ